MTHTETNLTTRRAALTGLAALATATGAGVLPRAAMNAGSLAALLPGGLSTPDPTHPGAPNLMRTLARMVGSAVPEEFSEFRESFPNMSAPRSGAAILTSLEGLLLSAIADLPEPVRVHFALVFAHFVGALLDTPEHKAFEKAGDERRALRAERTPEEAEVLADNSPDPNWQPDEDEIATEIHWARHLEMSSLAAFLFDARWLLKHHPEVLTAPLTDPFIQRVKAVFEADQGYELDPEDFFNTDVLSPDYETTAREEAIQTILKRSRKDRLSFIENRAAYIGTPA